MYALRCHSPSFSLCKRQVHLHLIAKSPATVKVSSLCVVSISFDTPNNHHTDFILRAKSSITSFSALQTYVDENKSQKDDKEETEIRNSKDFFVHFVVYVKGIKRP